MGPHELGTSRGTTNWLDPVKARHKFNNLKQQYNKVKAAMNCTGNGAEDVETFDHFDLMDRVLGSRDTLTLRHVALDRFSEGGESTSPSSHPKHLHNLPRWDHPQAVSRFTTCKFPIAIGYKRWCHI